MTEETVTQDQPEIGVADKPVDVKIDLSEDSAKSADPDVVALRESLAKLSAENAALKAADAARSAALDERNAARVAALPEAARRLVPAGLTGEALSDHLSALETVARPAGVTAARGAPGVAADPIPPQAAAEAARRSVDARWFYETVWKPTQKKR